MVRNVPSMIKLHITYSVNYSSSAALTANDANPVRQKFYHSLYKHVYCGYHG